MKINAVKAYGITFTNFEFTTQEFKILCEGMSNWINKLDTPVTSEAKSL